MASPNSMAPLVSVAKITKPVTRGAFLRTRLFDLLNHTNAQVSWIAGPPGSGKTILAATYAEQSKKPCVWLRLDEADADPASFFLHLTHAVATAGLAETTPLPRLAPEQLLNVPVFARQFFRALCQSTASGRLIVVDDLHELPEDTVVSSLLSILVQEVSRGTRVLLLSRKAPPRQLSRCVANKDIQEIGPEDLAMTLGETQAMFHQSQAMLDSRTTQRLHELTNGWAAGLALYRGLLKGSQPLPEESARVLPKRLQQYFDSEVIKTLPAAELDLLIKTAWLPSLTQPIIASVTHTPVAGTIVAELARKGLFVMEHETTDTTFYYHPLFRQMLKSLAEQRLQPDQLSAVQRDTAQALEQSGNVSEAIELWLATGAYEQSAGLIIANAPGLMAQAQVSTLTRWVEALPVSMRQHNPWLLFWEGNCRMLFSPVKGLRLFAKAYRLFKRQGDPIGMLLASSGGIEAIIADWQAFGRLDPWLAALEKVFEQAPPWPPELELRGAIALLSAYLWRQPHNLRIEHWAERVEMLATKVQDPAAMVAALAALIHYFTWRGEVAEAGRVYALTSREDWEVALSPMPYFQLKMSQAIYLWNTGMVEACYEVVAQGIERARTTGIHVMTHLLVTQALTAALTTGDTKRASQYLAEYAKYLPPGHPLMQSHHLYLTAWLAWVRGDLTTAWANQRMSFKIFQGAGAPFLSGLVDYGMAVLLVARGREAKGLVMLERAEDAARRMKSQHLLLMCLLARADILLSRAPRQAGQKRVPAARGTGQLEQESGLRYLAEAATLARRQRLLSCVWVHPEMMSRVCAMALDAGIEVPYVREMIHKLRLVVPETHRYLAAWPWPIKIYTLGRFELLIDAEPVSFPGRTQKRPLDLLKMVLAFGGREVSESTLHEALWPDAEGDAAAHAFEMLLKRLRAIVGHHDALVLKGGSLTLNPRLCWVDAWAFERMAGEAAKLPQSLQKALDLYGGRFLDGEDDPWAVATRERLRRKFLLLVTRIGKTHEDRQEWEQAANTYHRGLDVDDLAEDFYRGLMQCYAQLDQRAEAVSTYHRCRRALTAGLGLAPSRQTEQLYQQLTAQTS